MKRIPPWEKKFGQVPMVTGYSLHLRTIAREQKVRVILQNEVCVIYGSVSVIHV